MLDLLLVTGPREGLQPTLGRTLHGKEPQDERSQCPTTAGRSPPERAHSASAGLLLHHRLRRYMALRATLCALRIWCRAPANQEPCAAMDVTRCYLCRPILIGVCHDGSDPRERGRRSLPAS